MMETISTWHLPIKTVSEANCSEHWTKKAKRRKIQKGWIKSAFVGNPLAYSRRPELTVVITRIAPRSLDVHDNLPMSLKGIVDAIAEELTGNYIPGRADDDKRITWEYKQEKGKPKEYAVKIEIMVNNETTE
jgi:hypothetical protein